MAFPDRSHTCVGLRCTRRVKDTYNYCPRCGRSQPALGLRDQVDVIRFLLQLLQDSPGERIMRLREELKKQGFRGDARELLENVLLMGLIGKTSYPDGSVFFTKNSMLTLEQALTQVENWHLHLAATPS